METADLALYNGVVYPVAGPHVGRSPSAVALRGGRIVAVGSDSEIKTLVSTATEVIDLRGRMVVRESHRSRLHRHHRGVRLVVPR
jgi:predicted amidohydrolase YtcJ